MQNDQHNLKQHSKLNVTIIYSYYKPSIVHLKNATGTGNT